MEHALPLGPPRQPTLPVLAHVPKLRLVHLGARGAAQAKAPVIGSPPTTRPANELVGSKQSPVLRTLQRIPRARACPVPACKALSTVACLCILCPSECVDGKPGCANLCFPFSAQRRTLVLNAALATGRPMSANVCKGCGHGPSTR